MLWGENRKAGYKCKSVSLYFIILLVTLLFSLPAFGLVLTSKQTLCRAFVNGEWGSWWRESRRPALTS